MQYCSQQCNIGFVPFLKNSNFLEQKIILCVHNIIGDTRIYIYFDIDILTRNLVSQLIKGIEKMY